MFITFIDDYNRKMWAYLIKRKSEVFETFVKFKNLVEKQSDLCVKILELMGEGNMYLISFKPFVIRKALFMKLLPHTHLSIMAQLREEIEPL